MACMEKPRILVVEDDMDCAESLRRFLAMCGYQVAVAHTSQQGLEAATKYEPHIVLCDICLPDCDGYVTGSVLRQSRPAAGTRLIAVTGCSSPDDRRRALAAGFDEHLVKPVDPKVLLAELETIL